MAEENPNLKHIFFMKDFLLSGVKIGVVSEAFHFIYLDII
jgi:hypothetical protein